MNFDLILQIFSIIAVIFSGINFTFIAGAKIYWSLTFGRLKEDFEELKAAFEKEQNLNSAFRHKHVHDVEGLNTIIDLKFEAIQKTMTRLEKAIDKLADVVSNKE